MGVCLSTCGDAHQKAAVVAASISHHSASPATEHDPNHSLKKFLHLYDGTEPKKVSSSSPRPSLEDFLCIPHSSELFSLPSEDSDSSRSPSPARTSRGSIPRTSNSSRATPSPQKTRKSTSNRTGRFASDRPPVNPKGSSRKRPGLRRSSFSTARDDLAHKNLMETIARLERFSCDGRLQLLMEQRNSSVRRDLDPKLDIPVSSCAGLDSAQVKPASLILLNECHDLAQKLVGFSNRSSYQQPLQKPDDQMQVKSSMTPVTLKSNSELPVENVNGVPIEESVTCFLKQVEKIVSMVEAPQEQEHKSPIGTTKISEAEESKSVIEDSSSKDDEVDDNVQFTVFEATFDDFQGQSMSFHTTESSQLRDRPSCDSFDTPEEYSIFEGPALYPVSESALQDETKNPIPQIPHTPENELEFLKLKDSTSPSKDKNEKKVENTTRPALADINANSGLKQEAPPQKRTPVKTRPAPKGLRRGLSRSLDLRECSITREDFTSLRREKCQVSQEKSNINQAGNSNGSTDLGSTVSLDEPLASGREEAVGTTNDNAGEPVVASIELEPQKFLVVEIKAPRPSDSVLISRPIESTDEDESQGELLWTIGGADPSLVRGANILLNEDSKRFLSKAFNSILKLLQSANGGLTQRSGELLELLMAEANAETGKGMSINGSSTSYLSLESDGECNTPVSCEPESWHDAPASLSKMSPLESQRTSSFSEVDHPELSGWRVVECCDAS